LFELRRALFSAQFSIDRGRQSLSAVLAVRQASVNTITHNAAEAEACRYSAGISIDPEEAHELYKAFATATELQKKDFQNTRPAEARHRQGPS
jgi:hypothetical protein